MKFNGLRRSNSYRQINNSTPDIVFPLLCPEREKDWLYGWEAKIIYSKSGLIEEGCVFSTPHHGKEETIWYVTGYDAENYKIQFVRHTPHEEVVKINIQLFDNGDGTTTSDITYEYTALNEDKNIWIKNEFDTEFKRTMKWWEKAINYYLEKGEILIISH